MSESLDRFERLQPGKSTGSIRQLIDSTFLAYNSARLREACHVFLEKYAKENVIIGVSAAGALTPAGLGVSCLVPLMDAGLIDWIVITGANLYHDLHFALNQHLHIGKPTLNDCELRKNGIVRIYDILFKDDILFEADAYVRDFCRALGSRERIGSAEFHYLLGRRLLKEHAGNRDRSVLMTAAQLDIPVFTSSPGDSTLGMNMAAVSLEGIDLNFDVNLDVNQTASLVYWMKKLGGLSGLLILGGGSPKNFVLQTEPYIQEVLMLTPDSVGGHGHDFFIQFTDARPDTGGLSGATPSEAVSWGKITPEMLPDAVVCYGDTTVYLPLLTAYILGSPPIGSGAGSGTVVRDQKRLYTRLDELVAAMKNDAETRK